MGSLIGECTIDKMSDELIMPSWQGLLELAKRFPITDVRGRGLMVAAEFGAPDGGLTAPYGVAAKLTKACSKRNMILLSAGANTQSRPICAISLFFFWLPLPVVRFHLLEWVNLGVLNVCGSGLAGMYVPCGGAQL